MRRRELGLTLVEVLVATVLLGVAIAVFVYTMTAGREHSRQQRCRHNLGQLAKGMATYLNEYAQADYYPWPVGRPGCGTAAPDFGGAEWLACLYWVRIIPDPGAFLCPSSRDDNGDGRDLGTWGCTGPGFRPGPDGKLRPDAVSYAGMGDISVGIYVAARGAHRYSTEKDPEKRRGYATSKLAAGGWFPPNPKEPAACDDTEGTINHGERGKAGMNVLFFDHHVEFWPDTKVDLQRGVGMPGTDLFYLRN